jgi:di/tricarboxylate transporter
MLDPPTGGDDMDGATVTFAVLGLAIVGFVTSRLPLVVVALAVPLLLWATGVIDLDAALAGFSDPIVLFIASLFVVSEALDATGVTAWIARRLQGPRVSGRFRLLATIGLVAALLAAVISINGAVAALLPVVVIVATRAGIAPSKMLIPLAFAASAGSMLTLSGTPVNIVVSEAAAAAGGREFGYFEFALVGVPLVLATIGLSFLLQDRTLPHRAPDRLEMATADPVQSLASWRDDYRLELDADALFDGDHGVTEVLIAPRSTLIGRTVSPGMTTRDENLIVLALRRGDRSPHVDDGRATAGSLTLQPGDAVLVHGRWEALHRYTASPDVIAVASSRSMQRAVPMGRGARRAIAIVAIAVAALATGLLPPVVVGLCAAGALLVTRVLSVPQAFRSISWNTVVLIAGMIPLSSAFVASGAADLISAAVLGVTGSGSPHLALLVLCLLTLVLGQFVSNVATVLVMAPIAVSFAASLEVSIQPFMMALAVVGAAAFLTPIATPVNLMVMQPGGYRFGDYWRMGLPMSLVYLVIAVAYVPLIWPF